MKLHGKVDAFTSGDDYRFYVISAGHLWSVSRSFLAQNNPMISRGEFLQMAKAYVSKADQANDKGDA